MNSSVLYSGRCVDVSSKLLAAVGLVSDEWRNIYEAALGTLGSILTHHLDSRIQFGICRGAEIVSHILSCAKQNSMQLSFLAIKCIAAASTDNPKNKDSFATLQTASEVLVAMRFFGASPAFSEHGCSAIAACCVGHVGTCLSYATSGCCELLVDVLKRHCRNLRVVGRACFAIRSLCDGETSVCLPSNRRASRQNQNSCSFNSAPEISASMLSTLDIRSTFGLLNVIDVLVRVISFHISHDRVAETSDPLLVELAFFALASVLKDCSRNLELVCQSSQLLAFALLHF